MLYNVDLARVWGPGEPTINNIAFAHTHLSFQIIPMSYKKLLKKIQLNATSMYPGVNMCILCKKTFNNNTPLQESLNCDLYDSVVYIMLTL